MRCQKQRASQKPKQELLYLREQLILAAEPEKQLMLLGIDHHFVNGLSSLSPLRLGAVQNYEAQAVECRKTKV